LPQLLEKLMPFCVLIGAMNLLSRPVAAARNWWSRAPAGVFRLAVHLSGAGKRDHPRHPGDRCYNPMSANLRELSKRMEAELFGSAPGGGIQDAAGFWLNQVNSDGQSIINAARSEQQGVRLTGLTVFRFDTDLQFKERIEAREATLEEGRWAFKSVRRYSLDKPPVDQDNYYLSTTLTPAQVRNSFSTPKPCLFGNCPAISARPKARASRPQATVCSTISSSHSHFCWLQW